MAGTKRADIDRAIELVRQGHTARYEVVIETYHRQIRALLTVLVGNHDDVLELAQETFIFAYEHLEEYELGSSCLAWLRAIARNLALDHLRRQRRRRRLSRSYLEERVALRSHEMVGAAAVHGRLEQLERCVEDLAEDQRRFLRQAHGRTSTLEEVGLAVGRSGTAVRTQLSRLHRALRDCVERRLAAAEGVAE